MLPPENKNNLSKHHKQHTDKQHTDKQHTDKQQIEKLLNKHTLEHMNRDNLVALAKEIGITQTLNSPYKKKDDIINLIEVKTVKKSKTRNHNKSTRETQRGGVFKNLSVQTLNQIKKIIPNSINYDELNLNLHDYYPKSEKIYVLGDIHGDLMATVESLKLAGLIKISGNPDKIDNNRLINHISWNGGKCMLVQIGDQIDRTRPESWDTNQITNDNAYHDEGSDLKIMELFDKLAYQASMVGGCVISLLGNHELMNVNGDFRYVSLQEFREFGNRFKNKFKHLNYSNATGFPYGYWERKFVFKPGGIIATRMAKNRKAVVQIGKWVFVHGGFVPESALKYSIQEINHVVKEYLLGNKDPVIKNKYTDLFYNSNNDFSPFWSRKFGYSTEDNQEDFNKTIAALNHKNGNHQHEKIKGMIIGHTPQFFSNQSINSSFNNSLWRVDVGMSKAFGPRNDKGNNVHRNIRLLCIENNENISVLG